ncbi:hypothetical protein Q9L58_010804, partial [Maublancomyces gigas]
MSSLRSPQGSPSRSSRAMSPSAFTMAMLSSILVEASHPSKADTEDSAMPDKEDADTAPSHLLGLISMATSLGDVLETVPGVYKSCLRQPLRNLQSLAEKYCSAEKQVAVLQEHQRSGTFPASILAMRNPYDHVQVSREFVDLAQTNLSVWKQSFNEFRKQTLTNLCHLKAEEFKKLFAALAKDQWMPLLEEAVLAEYHGICEIYVPSVSPAEETR